MGDPDQAEKAMAKYGRLQEAFELAGGYSYPSRVRQVLNGMGFAPQEWDRRLGQLSGGERTRAFLSRLLLESPDLLILDEPTNHLDIGAVEWLENWLSDWPGASLIVSHDRYFLDQVISEIWELTSRGMETYRGNYTSYVQQREERRKYSQAQYEAQQAHIQKEEEYIRRNIAGQNAKQAKGRRKRLRRLKEARLLEPVQNQRQVFIDFGEVDRSGDHVLETHALEIGYPDDPEALFKVPDLVLFRGECVALMGPNGAGKTTFLKTILGEHPPLGGKTRLGASLDIGYFAQAHERLNPEHTVLEEILEISPMMKIREARDFLAKFLFRGDQVYKEVSSLSGGERGRLALAKLVLGGANFLLLDEPTNHLDIPSQEVLQEALTQFPGTILLVSHDRYLIDALATQIWRVTPEEQGLEVYSGGYSAYLAECKQQEQRRKAARSKGTRPSRRVNRKPNQSHTLEKVEEQIEDLEEELDFLVKELEEAGSDIARVRSLGEEYAQVEQKLSKHWKMWEKLAKEQE
jgi:ATP-binding cassette subfamily F protein 3